MFRKRKESDTDSEASQSARKKRSKPRPPGNFPSGRSTPLKIGRGESVRRDGPKWDPARIGKETVFVMGARYVVITHFCYEFRCLSCSRKELQRNINYFFSLFISTLCSLFNTETSPSSFVSLKLLILHPMFFLSSM